MPNEPLDQIIARARRRWPAIDLPTETFVAFLARSGGSAERHTDDLYLACACAEGIPEAFEAFEQHCMPMVGIALHRLDPSGVLADEVEQALREAMFMAPPGRSPTIAEYAGRGELRSWVRVIAIRQARRRLGAEARAGVDEGVAELVADRRLDPELALLRARYGAEIEAGVHAALESMGAEDRNLLRLQLLEGLTLSQIGALHQVDKATISRRLARIRGDLARSTRRWLAERLRVTESDLDSVIRLLKSELDITLSELVRPSDPTSALG